MAPKRRRAAAVAPVQTLKIGVLPEQLEHIREAHREPVIREQRVLRALIQTVLRAEDVLDKVDRQRGDDDRECGQVRVLRLAHLRGECLPRGSHALKPAARMAARDLLSPLNPTTSRPITRNPFAPPHPPHPPSRVR